MIVNINDYIKVKLTDKGLRILKAEHEARHKAYPKLFAKEFIAPEVDEQGYTRYQFHVLANVFGPYLFNGCEIPFETDIIIETKAVGRVTRLLYH